MNIEQKIKLISKCRDLRSRGSSLGEIVSLMNVPKTTVYDYVKDVILTDEQREQVEIRRKEQAKAKPNPRKGKCIPGRSILRPSFWSKDLVHIIAHFIFDGSIGKYGCRYYSKDKFQIVHVKNLVKKIFGINPLHEVREDGVEVISFYNVELADYVKEKKKEIFNYIGNGAPKRQKKVFLQAFFDDEGNIYYKKKNQRRIRGYQNSYLILKRIKELLEDFGICGRINKAETEIEITGRNNLVKFWNEINFSSRIYMNPHRKNSIWKEKIEKREILELALKSYKIKK